MKILFCLSMRRALLRFLLLISLFGSVTASATQIIFTVPEGAHSFSSLTWPTIGGFDFNPYWSSNYGADTRNAPYIPGNRGALTSAFGTFTFNSIEIGGWPWDDFGMGRYPYPILLEFSGAGGISLAVRELFVSADNSFSVYSENIEGVQSIAIGQPELAALSVRLGSITINEVPATPVPEPASYALMLLGLGSLWIALRNKKKYVTHPTA